MPLYQTNPNAPGSTILGAPGDMENWKRAAPTLGAAGGLAFLGQALGSPVGGALLGAGLNFAGNLYGANKQQENSLELARFQHYKNMELLRYQLDYNSPKNQMGRFADAGLNPNLVYGQGSSGNMESAPRYPDIQSANYQAVFADLGQKIANLQLTKSQTNLVDQKVVESGVKQSLQSAQADLVRANPFMRPEYVNAMVTQLESAATLKKQEAGIMATRTYVEHDGGEVEISSIAFQKVSRELDLLSQKFELGKSDAKIKAKILESKEFQNALSEIQLKWMQDGEITPQHIYMGIMMLLSKMM